MWKTTPVRVKQVPQDSTEWDRTDTGHSTDKHLHVWSRIQRLFWTPLLISYKKYIYTGSYLCVFIRVRLTSSIIIWFIVITENHEIMKPAYFIIWFSFNIDFRFSIKGCLQGPKGYMAQICEVHLQNGRFTLFYSKFLSNIYSILFS